MSDYEIKIGALYPLTSVHQYIGQSIKTALDFYIGLVNHQKEWGLPEELMLPDVGNKKIKLIWADTQGDPILACNEAKRLVEEGVTSIIGSYQSSVSAPVSFLTEMMEIPYVSPDTDAGALTKRGLKWFFKVGTDDTSYNRSLFKMLEANGLFGLTLGSLDENTLLGQGEVEALLNLARRYCYDVTGIEFYDSSFPRLKEKLKALQCVDPEILFTGQLTEDAITTLKIMKQLDYYPMGLFDTTSEYTFDNVLDAVGRDADYVISAVPWSLGITKKLPLAKLLNDMYRCSTGQNLNATNAISVTGLYVLLDSYRRAKSINPSAIKKSLTETNIPANKLIVPWCGIRFDNEGRNIYASSFVVQNFHKELKIVWPMDIAERKLIFPVPPWNCR